MDNTHNDKKSCKDQIRKKIREHFSEFLEGAGVRPTRQRIDISSFLFDGQHKHVTADDVVTLARGSRLKISLATVYNSLNHFVRAGILKQVALGQDKAFFDTNVEPHHHFFDEESGQLWDIPANEVSVAFPQKPPPGMNVERVEVTVFLRKPD